MRWQPEGLVLVGFDLLYLDGKDLRSRPLIERRIALEKLIGNSIYHYSATATARSYEPPEPVPQPSKDQDAG